MVHGNLLNFATHIKTLVSRIIRLTSIFISFNYIIKKTAYPLTSNSIYCIIYTDYINKTEDIWAVFFKLANQKEHQPDAK